MQTITIDILNNKAVKLLQDLELQKLIRLHKKNASQDSPINLNVKYKGAMTKQSLTEVDNQLNELRNDWE